MPDNKVMKIKIVTPDGIQYESDADSIRLEAEDGSIGIHRGHCSAIISIKDGWAIFLRGDVEERIYVEKGFAGIEADSVTILTKGCRMA